MGRIRFCSRYYWPPVDYAFPDIPSFVSPVYLMLTVSGLAGGESFFSGFECDYCYVISLSVFVRGYDFLGFGLQREEKVMFLYRSLRRRPQQCPLRLRLL